MPDNKVSPCDSGLPTISVIIPAYNSADCIRKCIESLTAQSVIPEEIIVVDNGSTDETKSIVGQYRTIRYIYESTPGVSFARNRGAKEATGNILAFIDADCTAESSWIAEAGKVFASDRNIHGILGISIGINENIYASLFQKSHDLFLNEIVDDSGRLLKIDSKNFFIRHSVFTLLNGFDTTLGNSEDVDLGIRLHLGEYTIKLAPSVVVHHRNPARLWNRIRVRKEQGFYDYRIFKKIGMPRAFRYYPAFARWYAYPLFCTQKPPRMIVKFLVLISECSILFLSSYLYLFRRLHGESRLYPVYHLLMAMAIFKGKLYARCVEAGFLALDSTLFKKEFSRRPLF